MAKTITTDELKGYSITTGSVLNEDYLTMVLTKDSRCEQDPEDRHSYFGGRIKGAWKILESAYPLRSQAVINVPETAIISISDVGIVRKSAPTGGDEEANVGHHSGLRVLGRTRLNEVRAIDGVAYTVGNRRSVYRRDAKDIWACIDDNCYSPDNFKVGFESIHGFSPNEIYAVGKKGEIWQYNGNTWHQLDSSTNAWLNKVVCADDGFVYVVGNNGLILKGRNDKWSAIEGISSNHEFWSIEYYDGRLFVTADTMLLFELVPNGDLELVDFGDCPIPTTAYHLTIGDGNLYCFGFKDIRKFNGNKWEEILTLY